MNTSSKYVVAPFNRWAAYAAMALANPENKDRTPLVIQSAPGNGKTGIVQAFMNLKEFTDAAERKDGQQRVIQLTSVDIQEMTFDTDDTRGGHNLALSLPREFDAFVIEDIEQYLTQEPCLVFLGKLLLQITIAKKILLMTSSLPLEDLEKLLSKLFAAKEDVKIVAIRSPDEPETRVLIENLSAELGISLSDEVTKKFLEPKYSSIRALKTLLTRFRDYKFALVGGEAIAIAENAIRDAL